jgi:hypothetical protein
MAYGTAYANAELDDIYAGTRGVVTLSIHDGDPGTTGANEITTTGGRIAAAGRFSDPAANKQKSNTSVLEWTGVPADNVAYVGAWIDGVFYKGGDVDPDVVTQEGNTFRIAIGGFTDTID